MAIFGKKTTEDNDEVTTDKPAAAAKAAKPAASMKDLYDAGGEAKPAEAAKATKAVGHGRAYRIIVKPLITEKASVLAAENKYFFMVEKEANKIEVAKAINEIYGVKPTSVNVIRVEGKKTRHGRTQGKRKDWKKAIVTLPKGKTIQVYEGV